MFRVLALEVYNKVVLKVFNRLLGNSDPSKSALFWKHLRYLFFVTIFSEIFRKRCENHFSSFPTDDEIQKQLKLPENEVVRHVCRNKCSFVCTGSHTFVQQMLYKVNRILYTTNYHIVSDVRHHG